MTLQGYTKGAYAANDYREIEDALYDMLRTVSNKSGISLQTLIDTVDLSLLHVGLWGARDLGAKSGIQLSHENEVQIPDYNRVLYLNSNKIVQQIGLGCSYQAVEERELAQQ